MEKSDVVVENLKKYMHISKYSRWLEKENRRETWEETVNRYFDFFIPLAPEEKQKEVEKIQKSVMNLDIVPSMRALMTAGKALERDHAAGYNCAARAINNQKVFDELFYLLMCGAGTGFSVERQFINQLPEVTDEFFDSETIITIRDSKIGWAAGLRELISLLYSGNVPKWDLSRVRPAGAKLKTFGGRSSGPAPLDKLFNFTVLLFKNAKGRKLNSIECHDLMCKIASTVIVGSVRRSACISFSNLTDDRMRRAKAGSWFLHDPQRALANNSTMYTEKPDLDSFTKEFRSMYKSKAGERGIVNQEALKKKAISCGRENENHYLLNPCGEAILNAETGQQCNLSEIIIRPDDNFKTLEKKVKQATILGTLQSTLTKFRYLSKGWQRAAEEDRLLGVSFTGIMDHPIMNGTVSDPEKFELFDPSLECKSLENVLVKLKDIAKKTNKKWAKILNINESKQIGLIKPSGSVSLLANTSSGIHPRFSKYYIRRATQDIKDPLTQLMIAENIPYTIDEENQKVYFSFFIKSPENCITQKDIDAIGQLNLWKIYQEHWCDGNPSQTIYYDDDTFLNVQSWVWENWDSIGGLSFFPISDHVYENAPYEEISKNEYERLLSLFPDDINWSRLPEFEKDDTTTGTQEFACSGGQCDL